MAPDEVRARRSRARRLRRRDRRLDSRTGPHPHVAHNAAVKAAIPSSQRLVFQVKDGWGPRCAHLGVPVPDEALPCTNDRSEFWHKVAPALAAS
ncbi:MAG: hypothetical protein HOP14_02920 [Acidobacteria bacterium]|nr:hypothetical protein [Acidobacteriota bacterium]